ncbi:cytochrome c oxidase subunit I [Aureimonas altamirensis]|uniref:cytochrome c oxidase subunit I n=1 Tax=Aureimonas altamirensis TaxID=370622 RepID=UPI00203729AD|nr:cytochrome c oxidase subunit I [Aureimonas altamirensis]MCM2503778.1 cytochrome c oxidase subunit I [Aureimonas altamirensis]
MSAGQEDIVQAASQAPVAGSPIQLHKALHAIWKTERGWGRLAAVNHTIVGRRFMVAAFVFFGIGGILSMIIRAQLATPGSAFVGPEIYGQIFTMHGTVMMFLFAIPMFEGFAIYMLPKILGARDLAFPRLSAYGFWCYVFGGSILIVAMLAGVAPDTGWFMYTPLSSGVYTPGINADVWLLGITFVEISAVAAAVEITVSILTMRAPGMSLAKMPLLGWYLLVTAGMMLVGFPPLILGSIMLEVERAFDIPFFDPTRGGDSLLWQHLFWLFGHPEVYIIFLPAAGAISTMLPALARRPIVGYSWIVVAVVAVGFLSFGLWVHHMFTVGIPHLALAFFSAASALVAVPTAVQIFAWLATLLSGRPQLSLPMLHLFGFFFVFVCGGLTGVMVAVVPFDWQVHDSHFVVAHLHYVLVGGFVFPMLAAVYYWLPQVTGRTTSFGLGKAAFWLIFVGFNLTFFLMHLTGLRGMPRRVDTYPDAVGWTTLNLLSSVGGFIMTIGFALFLVDVITQVGFGRRTKRNPWGAKTLEWATPVPPPSYAFASLPHVDDRDPLTPQLGPALARGEGYLGFARNGWQETLGIHPVTGAIKSVIILPRPTFLPLWSALVTSTIFLSLLFGFYWITPLAFVATIAILLLWTRGQGARVDYGPLPIGRGETALTAGETSDPPSVWAMGATLIANLSLFSSLAFGALFLWLVAPGWPPPQLMQSGFGLVAFVVVSAGAAMAAVRMAAAANRSKRDTRQMWLAVGFGSNLAMIVILAALIRYHLPDPFVHAYAAANLALVCYGLMQAFVGALLCAVAFFRGRAGLVSASRAAPVTIAKLWQDFTLLIAILSSALLAVIPMLVERVPLP